MSNEIVEEHAIDLQIPEDTSDEEFKKFVENLDIDKFRQMLRDEPQDQEDEE